MRSSLFKGSGLVLLIGTISYCWVQLVPPAPLISYLVNPAYFALVGATFVAPAYAFLVIRTQSPQWQERLILSLFLAAMPVIYFWAVLQAGGRDWAIVEAVGLAIFVVWAVVGYRRSTLLLGIGIAAHGVAWDIWHHARTDFIESWYPFGCLIVDLAFGFAVAARDISQRVGAQRSIPADVPAAARPSRG